jgi:hypothetical protein
MLVLLRCNITHTGGSQDADEQDGASAGNVLPPLTVLPYQVEELKAKLLDKHTK